MKDLRLMGPLCLKYKLYKYHLIIFTAVLSFCFVFVCQAQEVAVPATPAAKATNEAIDLTSLGIQIGEKVPDLTMSNIHNYKSSTAQISDFKGKLLILDFWATWCSPCVAMIPKMDSLQKEFGDKVQFLSVTYQKKEDVLPFMEKLEKRHGKEYDLPIVIEDNVLRKLFQHNQLPHYVWIDSEGIVLGITGMEEITAQNLLSAFDNSPFKLKIKRDLNIQYSVEKPLFVDNNGGDGKELLSYSLFSSYVDGLAEGYETYLNNSFTKRIVCRNLNLRWLYSLAYGNSQNYYGKNRTFFEVRDSSKVFFNKDENPNLTYIDWLKSGNAYCYELNLTDSETSINDLFAAMQNDLNRYIPQYRAEIEKRIVKSYALVRTSLMDKIKSKGESPEIKVEEGKFTLGNYSLDHFIMRLNVLQLQNSKYPIMNDSYYEGNVDLEIDANLSDVEDINRALVKYDLKFILKDMDIDVLVIRDSV